MHENRETTQDFAKQSKYEPTIIIVDAINF